jgi:hypothetical protein
MNSLHSGLIRIPPRRWALWLWQASVLLLATFAIFQLVQLFDANWREELLLLPRLSWYFLTVGWDALYRVPTVAWPIFLLLFCLGKTSNTNLLVYLIAPLLLASNPAERIQALCFIPLAFVAVLLNVVGFFTPILAGLAGQGAGH